MKSFSAKIEIIGVNPYVLLPSKLLEEIFLEAGKSKGHIPVKLLINEEEFIQTLVKYSGDWRLYLNMPMRKAAGKDVGGWIDIQISYDAAIREIPMNKKFDAALNKNKLAKKTFESLSSSRQKEIVRYINSLKTEESVQRNIARAINFLSGKERFVGRDKP